MATGEMELRRSLLLEAGAAFVLAMNVAVSGALAAPRSAEHGPLSPKREPVAAVSPAAGTIAYAIPAGDLAPALTQWAEISRLRLLAPSAVLRQLRTNGLEGAYMPEEALAKLLQDTGLSWRRSGAETVAVLNPTYAQLQAQSQPAIALDTIDVQGGPPALSPAYAGGQVARGGQLGVLGDRDVMDTPFNVTSYTAKAIADQQAQSVADVVKNDPSVRLIDPTNAGYAHLYNVRGLLLGNGAIGFDGLFGLAPNNQTMLAGIERVEVLKGPGGFLNGLSPSGVGGVINLVPKRAGDTPLTSITAHYMSNSQFGTQLDIGRRFGAENQIGVRANAVYRNGETTIGQQSQELATATLGLDYRGERLRLSLDGGYQALDTQRPNSTLAPLAGQRVPRPPSLSRSVFSPWNFVDTTDSFGMAKVEYDVTPDITVYGKTGISKTDWKQALDFGTRLQANGNFTNTSFLNNTGIQRTTGEAGLRARFETGPVRHQISLSVNSYLAERTTAGTTTLGSIASNIYNPVFVPQPDFPDPERRKRSDTRFSGFTVSDTLSILDERVQLTLGLRQQYAAVDNYDFATQAVSSSFDKGALTPVVGLVVKPWNNVSLYASYIEGLQEGVVVATNYRNAGEAFPPYVSRQYEAGAKVDWGDVITTLSTFEITQASGIANTVANTFSADGEQRNRGIELNVFGEPVKGLRMIGGVMLLDGVLTRTANGTNNVKTAPGAARTNISLGGEWDTSFIQNLTLTGRVTYTSETFVDAANLQTLPSWTTVDLGARYTFERPGGKPVILRAAVNNVFNKAYWTTFPGSGTLNLNEGRSYVLSSTFQF